MIDVATSLGPSAAARTLGISKGRVLQLAREGRLNPISTSLGRLFDRDEVERLRLERADRDTTAGAKP